LLYVVGGQARANAASLPAHKTFERGVVLAVDPERHTAERVIEYRSPADVLADDDANCLFKAATLLGDDLFLCTETEILAYSTADWRQRMRLTLPCFNDVHHVTPLANGHLLVAVTGLDLVVEIDRSGGILHERDVLGDAPWSRFSRAVDYRKVRSTQPHLSHPNYLFEVNGEFWVTRFLQRDAISLTRPSRRMQIGIGGPHDGCVFAEAVYFTTVDGHVVVVDAATLAVARIFDLQEAGTAEGLLGWCRGIAVIDSDTAIVGFSRLRPTRRSEYIAWTKRRMNQLVLNGQDRWTSLATRIACVDLRLRRTIWEMNLEEFGLNAVFSIHISHRSKAGRDE
jgi:hypothetical protein